jgi:hypothetical protein
MDLLYWDPDGNGKFLGQRPSLRAVLAPFLGEEEQQHRILHGINLHRLEKFGG